TQRSAQIKRGEVKVVSRPSRQTLDEVHRVGTQTTLFGASLAQQEVQRVGLPGNEDSQYYRWHNNSDKDQNRRGQTCQIPALDTALDA
ncbi:MAG: hypothetical protein WA180_10220, partial [Candidatus Sulfotelmatobacter sp.]